MIVFVNFNDYLGGVETILVRIVKSLNEQDIEFKAFYPSKSYMADDFHRLNIETKHLNPYDGKVDYYYLSKKERLQIVNHFVDSLKDFKEIHLFHYRFFLNYTG